MPTQSPHVRIAGATWRLCILASLSPEQAAVAMGCKSPKTASRRMESVRREMAHRAAFAAMTNSRDAKRISAQQCGLGVVDLLVGTESAGRLHRIDRELAAHDSGESPMPHALEYVLRNPLGRMQDAEYGAKRRAQEAA